LRPDLPPGDARPRAEDSPAPGQAATAGNLSGPFEPLVPIGPGAAVALFLAFACTYFFSALLRAVTATLAPVFSAELALGAADLGLLAGAFFFGFAALQLPLGQALDRWGPRRSLLVLLSLAVLGCVAFALANGLAAMVAARALIGAGLAAGLMAPLTCFRRLYSPAAQLRANSWMLMTGSLGMLASTLPVQWLLPTLGWRGLFVVVGACLLACMLLVAWQVPRDPVAQPQQGAVGASGSYSVIARHPLFVSTAPLGFFVYGGMIAVQTLWAGPWLTRVTGLPPGQAAQGLFLINLSMMCAFLLWGTAMPRLSRLGFSASRLMAWGLPLSLVLLVMNLALGAGAGPWAWAAWCVACTFVSVSQPAVGAAFSPALAGRAMSAFNLVIFSGVFLVQWGLGLLIDALQALPMSAADAFRSAFGLYGLCCLGAYLWFLWRRPVAADNAA
jgi:predicted MFS family arabinose efflux permease